MKIKFKDLSWPLKTAIVFIWIYFIYFILMFGVGFLIGLMEASV